MSLDPNSVNKVSIALTIALIVYINVFTPAVSSYHLGRTWERASRRRTSPFRSVVINETCYLNVAVGFTRVYVFIRVSWDLVLTCT